MAKEKFNPWLAVIFFLIPLAGWILFYFWNKGIKTKWRLNISPGLRTIAQIIPIANVIVFYYMLKDIDTHAGKVKSPEPWVAFVLFVPFANWIISLYLAYTVQEALNALNVETM